MRCKKITSLTNPHIKHVVQLRNQKQRTKDGVTIVEGRSEVIRALEAGIIFEELYIDRELLTGELMKRLVALKVPVYEPTKAVFSKISYGDRNDGILAICAPKVLSFKDFSSKEPALFVIAEGVEKPGNLGAILRTCDGAGVDGVIVCDGKTDIYNPNVIRASLGTVFSVKVVVSSNEEALAFLRSRHIKVCSTLLRAKTVYTETKLTDALAIVVGSEQGGLTGFWARHADLKVKIPMHGYADSLNVSVSTAILLYEAIRQRSG